MKQFLEIVPVALFVGIYFYSRDIYLSTAVLMGGICAQLIFEYILFKRIEKKSQIIFWIAMTFGGATLLFRNELFIQWKPTIINWIFAAVLLGTQWLGKANLLKRMLDGQLHLPDQAWRILNTGWSLGFILAGVLNLIVAFNFSLEFWVSYKLFGGTALTFLYMVITIIYLVKNNYLQEPPKTVKEEAPVDSN